MTVSLRPFTKDDILLVYDWRNEPSTRASMFNRREISLKEHQAFWKAKLSKSEKQGIPINTWIILCDGQEAGILRFDLGGGVYEVDIIIAKEWRGKSIGTKALKLLLINWKRTYRNPVIAKIKSENIASRKMFEKVGFKEKYVLYELDSQKVV